MLRTAVPVWVALAALLLWGACRQEWHEVMPHTRSIQAAARRRLRAVALGYLCAKEGSALIAVPKALASSANVVVQSMSLHLQHDSLGHHAHHHARLATRAAFAAQAISRDEADAALAVHRKAGSMKHDVSKASRAPRWADDLDEAGLCSGSPSPSSSLSHAPLNTTGYSASM